MNRCMYVNGMIELSRAAGTFKLPDGKMENKNKSNSGVEQRYGKARGKNATRITIRARPSYYCISIPSTTTTTVVVRSGILFAI